HPIRWCRVGGRQMRFPMGQTGGCDDVADSGDLLCGQAGVDCQYKPETDRIELELVERAWHRNLPTMLGQPSGFFPHAPAQRSVLPEAVSIVEVAVVAIVAIAVVITAMAVAVITAIAVAVMPVAVSAGKCIAGGGNRRQSRRCERDRAT